MTHPCRSFVPTNPEATVIEGHPPVTTSVLLGIRKEAARNNILYKTQHCPRCGTIDGIVVGDHRVVFEGEPEPQDLLRELLDALGEFSGARPETPKSVWEGALRKVRALAGTTDRTSAERCRVCGSDVTDGYGHLRALQHNPAHAEALSKTSWQSLIETTEAYSAKREGE